MRRATPSRGFPTVTHHARTKRSQASTKTHTRLHVRVRAHTRARVLHARKHTRTPCRRLLHKNSRWRSWALLTDAVGRMAAMQESGPPDILIMHQRPIGSGRTVAVYLPISNCHIGTRNRACHICAGTGHAALTSAPGLGSPRCHICAGTGQRSAHRHSPQACASASEDARCAGPVPRRTGGRKFGRDGECAAQRALRYLRYSRVLTGPADRRSAADGYRVRSAAVH